MQTNPDVPALLAVMKWIGACCSPNLPKEGFRENARIELFEKVQPQNGSIIQAQLLYSIALHSFDEPEESSRILTLTINLSLQLGLNVANFSKLHGAHDPVLEESWRRTWWELYLVDGLSGGIYQQDKFRLYHIFTDVPLPYEEREYMAGVRTSYLWIY
jgi:hypothetical protein